MIKKILIVEDEKKLADIIGKSLEKDGFHTDIISNGNDVLDFFYDNKPDLILLDINLPGINGWEICKEIREISEVPIIIMTARDTENEEIRGLNLGANDYVTKPFSPMLINIKIKKLLKMESTFFFKIGNISFNTKTFQLTCDDTTLELTRREAHVMEYFFNHKGEVLSRETLLNEVWGFDFFGDERAVDTLIKRLRKKLGKYEGYIKTIRGVGYAFEEI